MFIITLLTLAFSIRPVSQSEPYANSVAMREYLADRGVSVPMLPVIRGTAFIVESSEEAQKIVDDSKPDRLPSRRVYSKEEAALSPADIEKLVRLLHDSGTYMPDLIKLCGPSYDLGVDLVTIKGHTEILFCLSCDALTIYDEKDGYAINTDGGHNEILDLFQKAFPKNKVLKKVHRYKAKKVLKPETAISWAEDNIPNDPLLKRVKAMKREELTFEILEELANKATFRVRSGAPREPAEPAPASAPKR